MVPLETRSAKDFGIVQIIHLATDVDKPPREEIYRYYAPPAGGDMSVIGTFAPATCPLENITSELCSVFHSLPPGPIVARDDILCHYRFNVQFADQIFRSRATKSSAAKSSAFPASALADEPARMQALMEISEFF